MRTVGSEEGKSVYRCRRIWIVCGDVIERVFKKSLIKSSTRALGDK